MLKHFSPDPGELVQSIGPARHRLLAMDPACTQTTCPRERRAVGMIDRRALLPGSARLSVPLGISCQGERSGHTPQANGDCRGCS